MTFIYKYLFLLFTLVTTFQLISNNEVDSTHEYELESRNNVVFRPEDKNITFWGNESFLPQSFMFENLITSLNGTIEDPFLRSATNRQLEQNERKIYQPTWESLNTRVAPTWYDEAKIGVFVHWGVYSVPSFGVSNQYDGYAEWFLYEWKGTIQFLYVGTGMDLSVH